MSNTIGVIGCGWLGLPLAIDLQQSGYTVKGTTTSLSKLKLIEEEGIKAYIIKLEENHLHGDVTGFLAALDTLIINVPPGLRRDPASNYVLKIKGLLNAIENSNVKNIVFISSTSVYGDVEGEITELTVPKPKTESGKQLLQCEQLLQQHTNLDTSIIRFGGLIGKNRHPVMHLAGKKDLKNGAALINLIHLDDCIHMIKTIIKNNYWGILFNGVYPEHPTKKEYYTSEAIKRGLIPPGFLPPNDSVILKTVKSKNFLDKLNLFYTSISS